MKSFVSCEQKICTVCTKPYDTNTLLIDYRVKDSLESKTVTGYGLCQEHEELKDKGYVALVELDPAKSKNEGSNIKLEDAYRTGRLMHIKRDVLLEILKIEQTDAPLIFIEQDLFDFLLSLKPDPETEDA